MAEAGAAGSPAPTRVVLVLGSLQVGGTERQVTRLACELTARGHPVLVIATQGGGPLEAALRHGGVNVELVTLQRGARGSRTDVARSFVQLWRATRRWKPTAVHTFGAWPGMFVLPMAWLQRVPVRVAARRSTWAGLPFRRRFQWWLHSLSLACAQVVTANSQLVADDLVVVGGIARSKVRVIANGVDLPEGRADVGREPAVAVMVAQLRPEKGHLDLIEAVASLEAPPKVRLVGDGVQRPLIEEAIARHGLGDTVLVEGARSDASTAFAAAQFGVLASHREGLPNAVLEAFAYGVPVVATAVGGVPDLVVDDVTGLLVPASDPPALAAAIQRMAADAALRYRLGSAAAKRARDFSWERCVAEHETLYRDRIPRRGSVGRLRPTEG